jgi:2-dehydropantoate 2-reductase
VRILVVGAGVIGSIYADYLLEAGHEVELVARGRRLADLIEHGLVVEDMSRRRPRARSRPVVALSAAEGRAPYSLVLVTVRRDQVIASLPLLEALPGHPSILFFGNTTGLQGRLVDALGGQALFGFPAAGGVLDGATVRYLRIRQQQTMVAEPDGRATRRIRGLRDALRHAGFPTSITADFEGWLLGHAAFIVPIAYALYRCGTDAEQLAADSHTLRVMVLATRQAFRALGRPGNAQIPLNLRALYLRLPAGTAVAYWRRVMAGPRGELWFAAHCRAAPEEMQGIAAQLLTAVRATSRPAQSLEALLAVSGPWALSGSTPSG